MKGNARKYRAEIVTVVGISEDQVKYLFEDRAKTYGVINRKWFPDVKVGQIWCIVIRGPARVISCTLLEE